MAGSTTADPRHRTEGAGGTGKCAAGFFPCASAPRNCDERRGAPLKRVNKDHTSKPDENRKTHATTTCEGNNSGCRNVPAPAGKSGGTQMPATLGTTLATASAPSEPASEHSTADRSEDRAGDPPQSNPLTKNPPRPRAIRDRDNMRQITARTAGRSAAATISQSGNPAAHIHSIVHSARKAFGIGRGDGCQPPETRPAGQARGRSRLANALLVSHCCTAWHFSHAPRRPGRCASGVAGSAGMPDQDSG
jgi:hypothetical protein